MDSRRDFIKFSSALLLGATLPRQVRAASERSPGKISLGFSLYGMKTLPAAQALSECARIGYRNVELALMTGFPTDPAKLAAADRKAIKEQVAALGLTVSSLLVNIALVGDDKAQAAAIETIGFAGQFARELDPVNPPLIQTVMGGKPESWETLKESMAARLRAWGVAAAAANATVAVKGHVAHAVNSPDRLLWIIRETQSPAIVVAYDHSHFELGGIPMEESWRLLGPQARFIHVKEAVREGAAVKFLLAGEGQTDYRRYFQRLLESGYRGPVVVEVSSQNFNKPGYDPVKAAESTYAALAGPLATASSGRG